MRKRRPHVLFLDMKDGFNNVDHRKLLERLEENLEVPPYLTDWIRNFITTRNI